MNWPHKHTWDLVIKTHFPAPAHFSAENMSVTVDMHKRITFGFTEVLLECSKCNKTRKEILYGTEPKN